METPADRSTIETLKAFLRERLREKATIDWALQLHNGSSLKRSAVIELIAGPGSMRLSEPWGTAWHLIVESWAAVSGQTVADTSGHLAARRLGSGEISPFLVDEIAAIVTPRVEVLDRDRPIFTAPKASRRIQKVGDLFRCTLTSHVPADNVLMSQLAKVSDGPFLRALAFAVENTLLTGIQTGLRIGWDGCRGLGQLSHLRHRIEHSDRYAYGPIRGLAAATKLLCATVSRLAELDHRAAKAIVRRWAATEGEIHCRLWAAISVDPRVAPADDVYAALSGLQAEAFWDESAYPEVSELREKRFGELDDAQKRVVADRIQQLPPRRLFRYYDVEDREKRRLFWAVRAFQRIGSAGGILPDRSEHWLRRQVERFPELQEPAQTEASRSPSRHATRPDPESRFGALKGTERLRALETALRDSGGRFDEGRICAQDWLRQPDNAVKLVADFEASADGGHEFPQAWGWFMWMHAPLGEASMDRPPRNAAQECIRALALLSRFPDDTLGCMIGDIALWLSRWREHVVALPAGVQFWLRVWPMAVEATNSRAAAARLPASPLSDGAADRELATSDALKTPVAMLVEVLLAACPTVTGEDRPFALAGVHTTMRDAVCSAIGPSEWVARCAMLSSLEYFLRADPEWAQATLVAPLLRDIETLTASWHAVAAGSPSAAALGAIGEKMAAVAVDLRLDRETRQRLVSHIILDALRAFLDKKTPSIPVSSIQQMLRRLDDEVRDHAAQELWRHAAAVRDERSRRLDAPSAEAVCQAAFLPFLRNVWPQERLLTTIGVSRSFAALPALTGESFVETAQTVLRFLKPFGVWSISEYGFFDDEPDQPGLARINSPEKADAFLSVLARTIDFSPNALIPEDLTDALVQIRQAAPHLAKDPRFRRLWAACRRKK